MKKHFDHRGFAHIFVLLLGILIALPPINGAAAVKAVPALRSDSELERSIILRGLLAD